MLCCIGPVHCSAVSAPSIALFLSLPAFLTARCPVQAADTDKRTKGDQPALDEREFVTFYHSLLKRPDLEAIFSRSVGCPSVAGRPLDH